MPEVGSGPVLGLARGEPVAHPWFAPQIPWIRGIGLDLASELRHQRPEVLRLLDGIGAPDRLEDRPVRQHAVMVAHEQREKVQFLRRQANLLLPAQDTSTVVVDRQIARPQQSEPGTSVRGSPQYPAALAVQPSVSRG